jgi:ribose-phosphate pyrophosphokinase
MNTYPPLVFALNATRELGGRVAEHLGVELARHEEREFDDGEHKTRPLISVRDRHVYVVQSLYSEPRTSVNDKLCRLLFFIGALKDAAAASVTAVMPYLCYARKDRKTKSRDPVTTRYVAGLLESVGTDRALTVDVHNLSAFQNAFRCATEHLEAKNLFVEYFSRLCKADEAVVVSPDVGGIKRAEQFRASLARKLDGSVASAFMEKQRSAGVVSGEALVGNVADKTAISLDDLISSGTTISRAVRACRAHGAARVYAAATHGLFVGSAEQVLADPQLSGVAICDTVPPFRLSDRVVREKVTILNGAGLIAEAVHRIHTGGSVVGLLELE